MRTNLFKELVRTAALAATLAFAGDAAYAALSMQLHDGNKVLVVQNGRAISEAPVSFAVKRWLGKKPTQDGESRAEIAPKRISVKNENGVIRQELEFDSQLTVRASWHEKSGALRAEGELVTESAEDIPLTFAMIVPVSDRAPLWLVDLHRVEKVSPGEEKCVAIFTPAGAHKAMSRYSFGGINTFHGALGVGLPLNEPRIHRIRWDGKRGALVAECDVTLSQRPRKLRGRVPFAFDLFDAPREFGFRGLAQIYYQLNSASYAKRVQREGQWMPFTQLDKVERVEDFGFAFHEYHPDVSVAWDHANGVKPLVYCEPPVQYISLEDSFPRQLSKLNDYLASLDTPQGSAVRSGAAFDAQGQLLLEWVNTPWAKGARIPTNCDPDLLRTDKNPVTAFDLNWNPYIELMRRRANDSPAEWVGGGVLTDGVVGARGRAVYLATGENITQKFKEVVASPAGETLRVTAKGRQNGRLKIDVLTENGTLTVGEEVLAGTFREYQFVLPQQKLKGLRLAAPSGEVWIAKVQSSSLPLANADFEQGTFDPEMPAGLYMDSFEGWDSYRLNFRHEHLVASDFPLTFDGESGAAAQVIMMHNFEFAAEVGRRLHERGALLMANTALYQWPWSVHFLDILGIETPWGHWARTENLDFIRTMLYHKPYCFLLNVAFADFRGEKVEEYFAHCFHYGFWPGFFSHDAANNPYWEQPTLYNEDRPLFLKYMRVQQRTTAAGWEPVTLASVDASSVLVERWGGGPWLSGLLAAPNFYLTLFNTAETTVPVKVRLDPRLTGDSPYVVLEALSGQMLASGKVTTVDCPVGAHRSVALQFVRRDQDALSTAIAEQLEEIEFLSRKQVRYGHLSADIAKQIATLSADPQRSAELRQLLAETLPTLPELYREEWLRAFSAWLSLAAAREELVSKQSFAANYPKAAVPGTVYTIELVGNSRHQELSFEWALGPAHGLQRTASKQFTITIPRDAQPGTFLTWRIANTDANSLAPYYVTTVPVLPPILVTGIPNKVVLGDKAILDIELINNLNKPIDVSLVASSGCNELRVGPVAPIKLDAEGHAKIEVKLEGKRPVSEDAKCLLNLAFRHQNGTFTQVEIPVTILAQKASILRRSDLQVLVDSCYLGYSEKPLNDGATSTTGIDWANAAWASDEGSVPHWAQFEFPEPAVLQEVRLYWAFDDGHYWSSKKVEIQVRPLGSAEWKTVGVAETQEETPESVVSFPPIEASALRIYQAAGDGPPRRKGILWLREVEAR
ncbi:MAG: discoidin domain-containing protein [Candidatus Sumerlaeaceae bacterium]